MATPSIVRLCRDFERARIYPGVPEYFDPRGRGMYHYLTGSASWLLLTMQGEVFGVKGDLGDLVLEPKLTVEDFDARGEAAVSFTFASIHPGILPGQQRMTIRAYCSLLLTEREANKCQT